MSHLFYLPGLSFALQYFEHVEEAEWAVQVLRTTGKPVAATLCIGPEGDLNGVSPGDCAVKLVKAGMVNLNPLQCMSPCPSVERKERKRG